MLIVGGSIQRSCFHLSLTQRKQGLILLSSVHNNINEPMGEGGNIQGRGTRRKGKQTLSFQENGGRGMMAKHFKCVFIHSPFFFMVPNCKSQNGIAQKSFKMLHAFVTLLSPFMGQSKQYTHIHIYIFTYAYIHIYSDILTHGCVYIYTGVSAHT